MIDVTAQIEIAAAPADVAAVMFDPQREPEWMKVVLGVELLDPALAPGARVRRKGSLMGHEFQWTTEVEAIHFPHVLTLRIVDGPFEGTVFYQIQRSAGGSTVKIRNVGDAKGFGFVPASLISGPMQTAIAADLDRLKAVVEGRTAPADRSGSTAG
jgi:uncharacterized membrane protein